jgi:hypothetical protein
MSYTVTLVATILTIIAAAIAVFQFSGISDYTLIFRHPIFAILIVLGILVLSLTIHFLIKRKPLSSISIDTPPAFSKPTLRRDLSRLPRPSTPLVGRSVEIGQLTTALQDSDRQLVHICAPGGVGKSALIFTWLQKMQPAYHNVAKVFAWSFYSQGSLDTQTSSWPFFQVALPFFGFTGKMPKDEVERGRTLAKCLQKQSCILILDGLEPLQHPSQVLGGELKDVAVRAFLEEIHSAGLAPSPSLMVVSSRQPLVELEVWSEKRFIAIDLQTLPKTEGAQMLAKLGVKGTSAELEVASEEWGGHALALILLGSLLKAQFAGKIERRDQLPPLWTDPTAGGHALRVLQFYEDYWQVSNWVNFLLRTPFAPFCWHLKFKERVFLDLLGLFDRPMTVSEKEVLIAQADSAELLRPLNHAGWLQLETTLERAGLLLRSEEIPRRQWDCHPLIRQYFGQRFQEVWPQQYRQAHRVLFEYYQSVPTKFQPDTLEELEPLYRAVVHGGLAGAPQEVLDEVYHRRILREEGYL